MQVRIGGGNRNRPKDYTEITYDEAMRFKEAYTFRQHHQFSYLLQVLLLLNLQQIKRTPMFA